MISRRVFLREGSLAAVGLSMVPGFLQRAAMAAPQNGRRKTLVVVFQRGGADGLNTVVPFGEPAYYTHRPGIAIAPPRAAGGGALDLDGFFGLHPQLQALVPLYGDEALYLESRRIYAAYFARFMELIDLGRELPAGERIEMLNDKQHVANTGGLQSSILIAGAVERLRQTPPRR